MSNSDDKSLTMKERENLHHIESLQGSLTILINKFMPLLREIKDSFRDFELVKKTVEGFSAILFTTDEHLKKVEDSSLTQTAHFSEQMANYAGQITQSISSKSLQIESLDSKVHKLLAQFETLILKVDEIVKKQDQVNSSLEKIVPLEKRISEIQEQQEEIKTIVDAIYKPPEPVSTGKFTIHGIKLPVAPPEFKLQEDKMKLIAHLERFKADISKDGLIGSDVNEACTNARDGVIQTLLQRGPLVQFFSLLQDSMKSLFRDALPAENKNLISEEISKAIEFYKLAPVKDTGK
ncbi:MAG: hypothetical protein RBG13Loki_0175 [Promethearchaeota archaeon CR_4]|nr:MAG: hypothetical protein RBG13Loki_0175 [Candidatus Lokiarchaeota archaeon CR_4]